MAVAVTEALAGARHLVVEAGTGTGKSLAYLLPAALHALRRVSAFVVSTDTIGLQEQLIEKDCPWCENLVAEVETEPLPRCFPQGQAQLPLPQRWTAARHVPPQTPEEARLMARLLVWLRQTQTGDRAELNLPRQPGRRLGTALG